MTAEKQGVKSSDRFRVTSTRPHTGVAGPIGVPMLGFKNSRYLTLSRSRWIESYHTCRTILYDIFCRHHIVAQDLKIDIPVYFQYTAIYSYNIWSIIEGNNEEPDILRSSSVDQIGARKCEQGRGPPLVPRYEFILQIIPPRYAPPLIVKRVTRL